MKIVKALVLACREVFLKRPFMRKLLAYNLVLVSMTRVEDEEGKLIDEWKKSDAWWKGELPSIYDLDAILQALNRDVEFYKSVLKVDIGSEWSRDEVRMLMDEFEDLYLKFCKCSNGAEEMTLCKTAAKLSAWVEMSFWEHFKLMYRLLDHEEKDSIAQLPAS